MYKEFYLMQKEPFDSHPSPDLFYKSNVHQTAWHYLLQGLKQHEPILLVTGDYGAGKTLLYLKLIRLLQKKSKIPVVSVSTPTYSFVMVLEKIIECLLNIPVSSIDTSDEAKLQQLICEYFETKPLSKKEFVYVIIDDIQEFSYSFINKLRIFASYNISGYFPIRIVMFGHHSFMDMLNYKKMVAFGQRIKRIYYLKPLNFEETREYIYFRLIHSGATGTPVFDDEAIRLIQSASCGNPRLINNICDNCLLVSSSEHSNLVDAPLVRASLKKGNLMGIHETGGLESGMEISRAASVPMPDGTRVTPGQLPPAPPLADVSQAAMLPLSQENPRQDVGFHGNGYVGTAGVATMSPESISASPSPHPPEPMPAPSASSSEIPIPKPKKKIEYGKLGLIVALLGVVLFLFFYILGKDTNASVGKLGENKIPTKIVRPIPEVRQLYGICNHPAPSFPIVKNTFNSEANSEGKKLAVQYEPILLGEN